MRDQLKKAFVKAFDSGDADAAATIIFDCLDSNMDVAKSAAAISAAEDDGKEKGKVSGWAKMEVYKDKEGREIAAFVPAGGKDKRVILRGVVTLTMQVQMHPGMPPQPQQQRYEFPFKKGTSVRRAMETFDKMAEEAVENLKKQQEEKKHEIVAARGNLPPMIGPDGKPIRMGRPK